MKIRSKLILAFLSISLSSMILISFLFYSNEKRNLTRQIFNHLESVASIQHNRIKAINHQIEELSESEELIRNILNSTAEAILGMDMNANCTFCNPSCLSLLRYKIDDELIGKNIHQLMHHTRWDGKLYPPEECKILKLLQRKFRSMTIQRFCGVPTAPVFGPNTGRIRSLEIMKLSAR